MTAARTPRKKSPPRTAYHHGDLANALLRTSLTQIESAGVEAFSLREAAARCGVAVSAAYKHFPSRSAVLQAVAAHGFGLLAAEMTRRVERATRGRAGKVRAEAALVELGRTYILFAIARPALFRLMYGPGGRSSGANASTKAPASVLSQLLIDAIADVMRAYGHAPAKLESNRVIAWALVHGFAMMVVDGVWNEPGKRALDQMIAELGSAVLRSLR